MAVSAHDRLAAPTSEMEAAIYAALDAIDAYRERVAELAGEQTAADEPNTALVKRYAQFTSRADAMARIIEDDVISELLFCVDRLFSVELAERGEFI